MRPKTRKILYFAIPAICVLTVVGVVLGVSFMTARVPAKEGTISDKATRISSGSETISAINSGSSEGSAVSSGKQTPALQDANRKIAYLTFDDGPCQLTPELINTLNTCNVHATFFIIGLQAEKYPDTLKQMVASGDVIGVHSWTHKYSYIYKNTDNFLADFNELKDYITQETGVIPNVCRFPGGTNNTVSLKYNKDHIMRKIVNLVEGMGFKYYDWNVSSAEASAVPPSKDAIINTVISQCKNKKTAVILFHDADNQGYVDAIPEIVTQLRAMGFSFGTLSPDTPSVTASSTAQFKPV